MKAIEINNLSFRFVKKKERDSFHLTVPGLEISSGEFISILGPNGCGKSTLLKLISNLLISESPSIKIFDSPIENITLNEFAKSVAYVSQKNYSVFPYSVYEIVMMGRTPYLNMMGFDKSDDREIVYDAMKRMEVDHLAGKGIGELSGGEAQRVFIARALTQKSKIILLDEPNAHMDIEHQLMIFEMLKKINREYGTTILTVSHDLNSVGIFFDRVIIMKNGNIVFDGDKSSILTKEIIKEVFHVDVLVYPGTNNSLNVLVNPV